MTLWAIIVPCIVLLITALVCDVRSTTFKSSLILTAKVSAVFLVGYWIALRITFGDRDGIQLYDALSLMTYLLLGEVIALFFGALWGLTSVADRGIAARSETTKDA